MMQPQPTHEHRPPMPQAVSEQGSQAIVHLLHLLHHSWKPNQLLLITSIVQFILFVPLAWWARKHPQPPVEIALTRIFQHKQSSLIRRIVLVLNTLTGSAVFLNLLTVPTALLFWKRRLRLEAMMTIGISWTNALARTLVKQLIHRPRPQPLFVRRTKLSHGKSFPSGHVSSAITFWGWLFAVGMLFLKGSRSRQKGLLSLPILFIVLVGPSRIYLGEHWSTDVLGGYLFGGGWLSLSLRLYLKLRNKGILTSR